MKHDSQWPPPEWTEVIITWHTMNTKPTHKPPLIAEWLETAPGHGHYHLHGWRSGKDESNEGFAYRFEDPRDATYFKLIWAT